MEKLIEEFIFKNCQEVLSSCRINELENTAEINMERLIENLSKKQRKLLLKVSDAKDLIIEECSHESFVAGFKLGLKVGCEINRE